MKSTTSGSASFSSGTWSLTGSMLMPREYATAVSLRNGKVLVAGGMDNDYHYLATAELYTPATGTWSLTGNMSTPRFYHTATLLRNGKVLVAGGYENGTTFSTAELYTPAKCY